MTAKVPLDPLSIFYFILRRLTGFVRGSELGDHVEILAQRAKHRRKWRWDCSLHRVQARRRRSMQARSQGRSVPWGWVHLMTSLLRALRTRVCNVVSLGRVDFLIVRVRPPACRSPSRETRCTAFHPALFLTLFRRVVCCAWWHRVRLLRLLFLNQKLDMLNVLVRVACPRHNSLHVSFSSNTRLTELSCIMVVRQRHRRL